MEVVMRRQSGDLTHVLCVKKNETPAAEQNKKGFCPADSNVPKKPSRFPARLFFSTSLFYLKTRKENAKVELAHVGGVLSAGHKCCF